MQTLTSGWRHVGGVEENPVRWVGNLDGRFCPRVRVGYVFTCAMDEPLFARPRRASQVAVFDSAHIRDVAVPVPEELYRGPVRHVQIENHVCGRKRKLSL